jgi:hypothetical protein
MNLGSISQISLTPLVDVHLVQPTVDFGTEGEPVILIKSEIVNMFTIAGRNLIGVPRQEIMLPISWQQEISDERLFEDSANLNQKFCLPRYRIVERDRQMQISFATRDPQGWALTIELEKYPAPDLEIQARDAQELPHQVSLLLRHPLDPANRNGDQKEWLFQPPTSFDRGIRAVLWVETQSDLNLLFQVLTNPGYAAALIVRRTLQIGLPIGNPFFTVEDLEAQPFSSGVGVLNGTQITPQTIPLLWSQGGYSEYSQIPEDIRNQRVAKVYLGTVDFAGLSLPQLESLPYSYTIFDGITGDLPKSKFTPGTVFAIRTMSNHYAKVQVTAAEPELTLRWEIYAKDINSIHDSGQELVELNGQFLIGRGSSGAGCEWFQTTTESVGEVWSKYATMAYLGDVEFEAVSVQQLAQLAYSNSSIILDSPDPSQPSSLLPRTVFAVATGDFYAKVQASQQGSDLLIRWATYPRAMVVSYGRSMADTALLGSNGGFNLDTGMSDDATPDFIWDIERGIIRSQTSDGSPNLASLSGISDGSTFGFVWNKEGQLWVRRRVGEAPDLAHLRNTDPYFIPLQQLEQLSYVNTTLELEGATDSTPKRFAVRTHGGNYARVEIVNPRKPAFSWITYRAASAFMPLFQSATRILDTILLPHPFAFPKDLYGYIYTGVTAAEPTFKLRRWSFVWQGRANSYYQDPSRAEIIYYLPDCFKLLRKLESPRSPMISIYFSAVSGGVEDMNVTLEYAAFPFTDLERLKAAAQELNQAGVSGKLLFQPLMEGKPRLFLRLPQPDGSILRQEFPDVPVELRSGFKGALTVSLKAFQSIFTALFSSVTELFQGEIQIDFANGSSEILPFRARMDDLMGELVDITSIVDPTSSSVQVTLKNTIESQIRISSLNGIFGEGEIQIPGVIGDLSVPLPTDLPPEGTLACIISSATAIDPQQLSTFRFNPKNFKVLPNRDAIFKAILRPDSPSSYKRLIILKIRKVVFGDRITDISINFKQGNTVTFSYESFGQAGTDSLSGTATLLAPISNWINQVEDSGEYEFRTSVILKDGSKIQDPPHQWRTDNAEQLTLSTSDLPPLPT